MITDQVLKYIIDSEMDLEELIHERLGMTHEDLVAELLVQIIDNLDKFQDIERTEV